MNPYGRTPQSSRPKTGLWGDHWPSFAHCFADSFAGAAEQDIRDVLTAFEHAGWLTADSAGHRITQEAMLLARSGRLPPLQRNKQRIC